MTKIILIGGTPRAGKTTLSQKISNELKIPWISADVLCSIAKKYTSDEKIDALFPMNAFRAETGGTNDDFYNKFSAEEITSFYLKQGETVEKGISVFVEYAISEGWDYIIEGYQVTPNVIAELKEKYPEVETVVLVNTDSAETITRSKESSVKSDWLRDNTHVEETFKKIGQMINFYSQKIIEQCEDHMVRVVDMSEDFENKSEKLFQEFTK